MRQYSRLFRYHYCFTFALSLSMPSVMWRNLPALACYSPVLLMPGKWCTWSPAVKVDCSSAPSLALHQGKYSFSRSYCSASLPYAPAVCIQVLISWFVFARHRNREAPLEYYMGGWVCLVDLQNPTEPFLYTPSSHYIIIVSTLTKYFGTYLISKALTAIFCINRVS